MNELPLAFFSQLPEYRSPAWVNTVPRELVKDRNLNAWEYYHPVPISRVRGWENVATRIWANVLSIEANYDEAIASILQQHGHMPEDPERSGQLGELFYDAYKGIAFFAGFADQNNFFRACWLTTVHAVLIEEVGSKTDGKNGGWGLTKALLDKLVPFAKGRHRPIHVSAVSPESEALFRHFGFSKADLRLTAEPHNFRSDLILHP